MFGGRENSRYGGRSSEGSYGARLKTPPVELRGGDWKRVAGSLPDPRGGKRWFGPSAREVETIAEGPGRRKRGGLRPGPKRRPGRRDSREWRYLDGGVVAVQLRVPPPFLQHPGPDLMTSPQPQGPRRGGESVSPFPSGVQCTQVGLGITPCL